MKVGRVAVVSVTVLLLGTVFLFLFLGKNIDSIVKDSIEKYGSAVTRTRVSVASVALRPTRGQGIIRGLSVSNPAGFVSPHAFTFSQLELRIDLASLPSGQVVIIDNITMKGPVIQYELNKSGRSNIGILRDNVLNAIQRTAGSKRSRSRDLQEPKKFYIRKLVIEKGEINALISAMDRKAETLALRRIELKDIGKGRGASPTELGEKIIGALIEEVGVAVVHAGIENYYEKEIDRSLKHLLGK